MPRSNRRRYEEEEPESGGFFRKLRTAFLAVMVFACLGGAIYFVNGNTAPTIFPHTDSVVINGNTNAHFAEDALRGSLHQECTGAFLEKGWSIIGGSNLQKQGQYFSVYMLNASGTNPEGINVSAAVSVSRRELDETLRRTDLNEGDFATAAATKWMAEVKKQIAAHRQKLNKPTKK